MDHLIELTRVISKIRASRGNFFHFRGIGAAARVSQLYSKLVCAQVPTAPCLSQPEYQSKQLAVLLILRFPRAIFSFQRNKPGFLRYLGHPTKNTRRVESKTRPGFTKAGACLSSTAITTAVPTSKKLWSPLEPCRLFVILQP